MQEPHKVFVAVNLILRRGREVLLLRRHNTGYEDGNYGLPSGHLEEWEHPSQAAAREGREETGVDVVPGRLSCVHVVHRSAESYGREYVDFFFAAAAWSGEPKNMEPERCDECAWFPLDALPPNTIGYIREVLLNLQAGKFYSER